MSVLTPQQEIPLPQRLDGANRPSIRWRVLSTLSFFLPCSDLEVELPSTAWPCRLRHVLGQSTPKLTFDPVPFKMGIAKLQEHRFGSKMLTYQPPTDDDPFADILEESTLDSAQSEDLVRIYSHWKNLPKQTRRNLLQFEDPDFELRSCAEGETHVTELVRTLPQFVISLTSDTLVQLGQLNDVVRLCHCFHLGFSFDGGEWPLLCVEFESLRNRHVDGISEV